MPFSSNPLLAPVFQSPVGDRRDHRPPVVSIKRAEDAIESGIRLHHNQRREGYILQPEVEGLGVAPVELQSAPLASGGSVARHARLVEGDVFLPITLASPVPSALPGMFDALVEIARPGQRDEDGLPLQFEVVVYDPYGQETRSRRLIFESGLGDPVRVNHHVWRTSITGRFVDPFWYGQVRELRRTLGSVDKKFITASKGELTSTSPTTYEWEGERHNSPSVKKRGGEVVARNILSNPSFELSSDFSITTHLSTSSVSYGPRVVSGSQAAVLTAQDTINAFAYAALSADIGSGSDGKWVAFYVSNVQSVGFSGSFRLRLGFDVGGSWSYSSYGEYIPALSSDGGNGGLIVVQVPSGASREARAMLYVYGSESGGSASPGQQFTTDAWMVAVGETEAEALDQVADYFDGSTPSLYDGSGAYEFPFFPVRIGGSVVQGEYELQVEGDAPAYWSGVITPPGEDLLIQNAKGERIFVQGRVDEPILIQTRPQEQDITLADGTPIWDRIDPGDDDFFPLHPGRNTVHVSMVGATQQSEILIRYREAFFHSLGGGR